MSVDAEPRTASVAGLPLAVALLAAPLAWWPGTIQVYLFKGLLLGGLAGLSLLCLLRRPAGVAPVWTLAPLLVVGWAVLSRKLGADPFRADLAALLLVAPLLVHLAALADGEPDRLMDLALVPGALLAAWLLLRHLGGWLAFEVDTPLGHKNRLAAYLALCLPWAVVRTTTAVRRTPWIFLLALLGTALAVSGTRGAWLGGGCGLFVVAALLGRRRELRRPLFAAGAALLLAAGAMVALVPHARGVVRGAASGHSLRVRALIWPAALRLAAERPLAGHGAGQFPVQYPRLRPPEEMRLSGADTIPETPHNDLLQVLLELGAPALLLSLLWGGWLLLGMRRTDAPESAGWAGVLVVALAHGSVSSILLSLGVSQLPALAAAGLALAGRRSDAKRAAFERGLVVVALGLFVLLPGRSLFLADLAYEQARRGDPAALATALSRYPDHPRALYLQGRLALRAGDAETANRAFEHFLRLNPHSPAGRNNRALAALAAGRPAEARALWEALAREQPDYTRARTNLALLDFREGVKLIHDRAPIEGMRRIRRAFAGGYVPRDEDFRRRPSGPIVRVLWQQHRASGKLHR